MPRWLSAVLFFGTALAVWSGLHLYLYARVASGFDLDPRARLVLKVALGVLAVLYLAGRLADRFLGPAPGLALLVPGAYWLGVLALAFTCLLAVDVAVTLPLRLLAKLGAMEAATASTAIRWAIGAAMVATLAGSAVGTAIVLRGPQVTALEVPLPGLPAALDGYVVTLASDVHAGELITSGYVDRIARTIESTKPDLVVLAGDLTDETDGGDGRAFDRLASIPAPDGVFASLGNHEMYAGGEGAARAIEAHGIPVLRQGFRVIRGGLVLAGVDDPAFAGGRAGVADGIGRALDGRPAGLPVVLLSHQPVALDAAVRAGVGLMLCGHTHGGQMPPFTLLTRLAFPRVAGRYDVDGMTLVVSTGAGFWGPPIRLFASPEVVRITLRAGAAG